MGKVGVFTSEGIWVRSCICWAGEVVSLVVISCSVGGVGDCVVEDLFFAGEDFRVLSGGRGDRVFLED